MAVNILDALKGQLGGALVGQLGKQLGVNSGAAQSGIDAILPSILGGLMKKASTPVGAGALNDMLEKDEYNGGLLEKLPGMLGGGSGGDPSMMTNLGMTVLKSLFGENIASIAALIAKFTGMNSDKSTSLLAILAPLVMSYLGAKKRADGLDAKGLSSLLMSQKDSVAKSLPPGFAGALGLGSLGITDAGARRPVAATAPASTQSSGSGLRWLIPVLILCGLAVWAYLAQNKPVVPNRQIENDAAIDDLDDAEMLDVEVPAVELTDTTAQLTGLFDEYRAALSDVTDEASAKAAVPSIMGFNEKLGGMTFGLESLPEVARTGIADKVKGLVEPIQAMIDKLYAIPGVKPILEPVIANMLDKLKPFLPAA